MRFKRFFQKIFGSNKPQSSSRRISGNGSEKIHKMMAMLSDTREKELTCDEVFALLDQFTELAAQGEDVARLMPLVQQHLDMCEDCREEYKVLQSILHGTV